MTPFQKVIKYLAMAFAIFLVVSIIGGILSIFGLLGGFSGGEAVTEEIKTYAVSSDIQCLEVKVNAADLTIKEGESFSVESNLKHLTVEDKNGILAIRETKKFGSTYTGAILTLYVPADTMFEKVNIITGAGRLTVEQLSADTISFELGAGEVMIDKLIATSDADVDGGAGKVTISDGVLCNLDLDMGVGTLSLTAALSGECEFDLGVGQTDITVLGNKDDYSLDIEKGLGNITVDGTSVLNFQEQGSGSDSIEINGGIGTIHLDFRKPM